MNRDRVQSATNDREYPASSLEKHIKSDVIKFNIDGDWDSSRLRNASVGFTIKKRDTLIVSHKPQAKNG
jgi:hypothetical protein